MDVRCAAALFGWLSRAHGVDSAGWLLALIADAIFALLVRARRATSATTPPAAEPALVAA